MLICLDTTAILNDPMFRGIAWRVVAQAAPAWNLRLVVPEVVITEAIAGYRRRIAEALVGFERWGDKHAGPLGLESVRQGAEAALNEAFCSYPTTLRNALSDLNATVIEPPEVAHMILVERAAARRRPCNANGDGYRDTLNWLTVLALASEHQDESIVWVSDNSEDFGSDADAVELHQDLVADLARIGAEDRVWWIRTLPDVVLVLAAEHSPEAPADLPAIRARLREQALSQFISTEVLVSAVERPVGPRDCGLPTATKTAKITTVGEPKDLQLNVRGAVGNSEAVVEFVLEAETSILVDLPPDSSSEDPRFSVVSTDITGTTGQLLKPLRFSGLITLDRFDRPQGGELTRVTARRDDPGLLAWKLLTHRRWFTGVDLPLVPPDLFNGFQQQLISPDVFKGFQQQMIPDDFFKGLRRQMIRPDLFKGLRRQMIPDDFFNGLRRQMVQTDLFEGLQQQMFPEDFFKGFQRPVTQPDRTDDVRMPDNGKEQSTSQDSRSTNLGETDESDEPTDA